MPIKRHTALTLLATAGATAALAAIVPLAAVGGPGVDPNTLPDLRSDPPEAPQDPEVSQDGRLLLKFNGFVTNVGNAPLHLAGNPQVAGGPKQYAFLPENYGNPATWTAVRSPEVLYETNDGHNHFHYMRISRYSLWNQAKTAEVAPGQKVGFCLYDSEAAPGVPFKPPVGDNGAGYSGGGDFCRQNNPGANTVQMGVSPNYRDVYDWTLALQWVDISNTSPGRYYLAAEADPEDQVLESNEANNQVAYSAQTVTVPGYVATAIGPVATPFGQSIGIQLGAAAYEHPNLGALGAPLFRVTSPPANGSLNVTAGQQFTNPIVTYVPNPGFGGVDTFEYEVRDPTSGYPLSPPRATAAINVASNPSIAVAISGAPATLVAGTSAQLKATVVNGTGRGVSWTVNGVAGGNSTAGTISAGGLYKAPAKVPSGGKVTIKATSKENSAKSASKRISIIPPRKAKPSFSRGGTMAEPLVTVARGKVSVRNLAKKAGRYTIIFKYKGKRFARRTRSAKAGRVYTTSVKFPKGWNRKKIRIAVAFKPNGGKPIVKVVGPTALSKVAVKRKGRVITARTKTLRTGQVLMLVSHGKTVLRRCRSSRLARGTATCKASLRAGMKLRNVRVTAQLTAEDGLRAVRRGRV
ncbi:MAG: lysyl oxidase family protein [Thermoleophilia bacterium]|nr:lysyl oxidase family protein [Thermoleophilia bacterium]MDH3724805.1 lysyl oxidase family protein [Thermoleophilia bacterium]